MWGFLPCRFAIWQMAFGARQAKAKPNAQTSTPPATSKLPPLLDALVDHIETVESIKIKEFKSGRFNHEIPRVITFGEAAPVFGKDFVKVEVADFMLYLKAEERMARSEVVLTADGKVECAEYFLSSTMPISLKWTIPQPAEGAEGAKRKLLQDVLHPAVFGSMKGLVSFGSERLLFPCVHLSTSGTRLCVMMRMLDILECPAMNM